MHFLCRLVFSFASLNYCPRHWEKKLNKMASPAQRIWERERVFKTQCGQLQNLPRRFQISWFSHWGTDKIFTHTPTRVVVVINRDWGQRNWIDVDTYLTQWIHFELNLPNTEQESSVPGHFILLVLFVIFTAPFYFEQVYSQAVNAFIFLSVIGIKMLPVLIPNPPLCKSLPNSYRA